MAHPMISNSETNHPRLQLGHSDLMVSPVSLGCWPMAGITSLGVNDDDSVATIRAAIDSGINFIDTANSYGYDGESDRLICRAIAGQRDRVILAAKVGTHWNADRVWTRDGRPEVLLREAEQCLERLGVECVDLMYLHTPDPNVPIVESADAIAEIVRRGWARYAGVSNVSLSEAEAFHGVCPVVAIQTHFNMLQPESVDELREFCKHNNIALVVFWVLMKGLLAGKMGREFQLDAQDRRRNYAAYQGERWNLVHDLLDELRRISRLMGCTVSQLVIAWTCAQPQVSVALVGAKRVDQIQESAAAMSVSIDGEVMEEIDGLIRKFIGLADWKR